MTRRHRCLDHPKLWCLFGLFISCSTRVSRFCVEALLRRSVKAGPGPLVPVVSWSPGLLGPMVHAAICNVFGLASKEREPQMCD